MVKRLRVGFDVKAQAVLKKLEKSENTAQGLGPAAEE